MPETTDEHKKKKPRQLFSQPELKRLEAEYAQLSPGHGYGALAKELAKELSLDPVRITYAPSTPLCDARGTNVSQLVCSLSRP